MGSGGYERYAHETLTRRRLLQRAGLLTFTLGVAPAVLSACGGGDEEGATTAEASATTTTPETTVAGEVETQASGNIDFLWWQGYDLPDVMGPFLERTGIRLKPNFIAGHDDIQAKITAGGQAGSFDLTGYCQCYKSLYRELGILSPIDESKIPNLGNLLPFFAGDLGNYWVEPDGTRTGVPWTWGVFGINYDSAAVPGGLKSYADLLDSAYTGKVGVVDDQSAVLQQACRYLGLDITQLTDADFDKVKEFVEAVVAQSKGVAPAYGDLVARFTSDEIVVAFPGWTSVNKFAADAGKTTIETSLPKEGGFTFVDAFAIPVTADNPDAAYAWINELMIPEINGKANNAIVQGATVKGAVEFLEPDVEALMPYDALEAGKLQEVAPVSELPPTESDEFVTFDEWLEYWQGIKAGG